MTPEHVRTIRFGKPPFGQRGYHPAEVDAFCARIAEALAGRAHLTAADIRTAGFGTPPFGHRGYDRGEVDDFLDDMCVELEFARHGTQRVPGGCGAMLLTHDDIAGLCFSAPPLDIPGYAAEEVDDFLDRVVHTLAHDGPDRVTADEVRAVGFGLAAAGTRAYHRGEVDAFTDLVAHTLEESARSVGLHRPS